MERPLLLTPGPTPVPPKVREALAQPMIHHRTPEFQAILKEVGEGLKALFGTRQEVLILTSSGTGAMEAAVSNLLSPGEEALVIRGGKFGERWGEICDAFGIKGIAVDVPWGKPLDLNRLASLISQNPKVKALFATLCETSTGATFDVRGIRRAVGEKPLLVVDAISGLGADPFEMDSFGVDVTVCGSQKGLMLPPGLSFIALSDRAWEAVEKGRSPRYYFNLALARKAWGDTDTPFTPGINLVIGLAQALKEIHSVGLSTILATHRANAQKVREAMKALGLELYVDPACASNAVTTVKVPAGVDGKELLMRLRSRHGVILAGGQGKEAGKVFRIATMGAIGEKELEIGLSALEKVLADLGWTLSSSRKRGSGPRSRISRTTLRVDSRWSLPSCKRGRE